VPTDSTGNALPFFLLVSESGNDTAYTDAQVQSAASYVAQQIVARFPTGAPYLSACLGLQREFKLDRRARCFPQCRHCGGSGSSAKHQRKVPFVDTYAAGVGAPKLINGLGTVANPQPGTNSN